MFKIILLIIAISSDAFICMLESGATFTPELFKNKYKYSLIFCTISLFMLSLGYILGKLLLETHFKSLHYLISAIIMLLLALILLVITFKRNEFYEHREFIFTYKKCLKIAIFSCLDICLVGVSLSMYPFLNLLIPTLCVTFFIVLLAINIGYYHGARYQKIIGIGASLIYFIIANVQLFQLMNIL